MRAIALAIILTGLIIEHAIQLHKNPECEMTMVRWGIGLFHIVLFWICLIIGW